MNKSSKARKEFLGKTSLLLYLSYYMDIETINKMILLNKHFYEIYTNDIVWYNIFHQNFTKLRIIENPDIYAKSKMEKNELGKKRKRFISAMKNAKNNDLASYKPPKEDSYNVIVTGYLNYMPVEDAIVGIYGANQDIFSFFNCYFFYDERISLLSMYSCPNLDNPYTINNTDCFVFAVNRNFPSTIKYLEKAKVLLEDHKCENVIVLENTYIPNDLNKLADKYSGKELKELKTNLQLTNEQKSKDLDDFLAAYDWIIHIKVDICSNKAINDVFYTIIEKALAKKLAQNDIDDRGRILTEAEISAKIKDIKVSDPYIEDPNVKQTKKAEKASVPTKSR